NTPWLSRRMTSPPFRPASVIGIASAVRAPLVAAGRVSAQNGFSRSFHEARLPQVPITLNWCGWISAAAGPAARPRPSAVRRRWRFIVESPVGLLSLSRVNRRAMLDPAVTGFKPSFGRMLLHGEPVDVGHALVHGVDVAELRVDVEKVPRDGARHAVADAFLHRDGAEAVGDAVADGLADAGAGGDAGHEDGVDVVGAQDPRKLRPVERRGPLLQQRVFALDR